MMNEMEHKVVLSRTALGQFVMFGTVVHNSTLRHDAVLLRGASPGRLQE